MRLRGGALREVNLAPLGDKILGGHGRVANSAGFSRIGMGIFYTKAAAVSCFMVLRAMAQECVLNARLIIQAMYCPPRPAALHIAPYPAGGARLARAAGA